MEVQFDEKAKETIEVDKGYIKLSKNENLKKISYNWEIKMYQGEESELHKQVITAIEDINNVMLTKFTSQEL